MDQLCTFYIKYWCIHDALEVVIFVIYSSSVMHLQWITRSFLEQYIVQALCSRQIVCSVHSRCWAPISLSFLIPWPLPTAQGSLVSSSTCASSTAFFRINFLCKTLLESPFIFSAVFRTNLHNLASAGADSTTPSHQPGISLSYLCPFSISACDSAWGISQDNWKDQASEEVQKPQKAMNSVTRDCELSVTAWDWVSISGASIVL